MTRLPLGGFCFSPIAGCSATQNSLAGFWTKSVGVDGKYIGCRTSVLVTEPKDYTVRNIQNVSYREYIYIYIIHYFLHMEKLVFSHCMLVRGKIPNLEYEIHVQVDKSMTIVLVYNAKLSRFSSDLVHSDSLSRRFVQTVRIVSTTAVSLQPCRRCLSCL